MHVQYILWMMSGEIRNTIEEISIETECSTKSDGHFQSVKKLFVCELCNVQVTSNNVLRRHKEGRRHIMREERQGKTFQCDLCKIEANSQSQLDAHLKSSKHNARLIKKENASQMMKKGVWIIVFGIICIFINLLLLFKYINKVL